MMGEPAPTVFQIGDGRLDLRRRELFIRGQLADLQPLTFDLLAYFVANVGRVVRKDELLTKVWGDSVGSDAVIARAVMKVRRAIGDDGQEPRHLKTVHRVGYRLDMPVQSFDETVEKSEADSLLVRSVEAASLARVLLPCRNRTGESAFDWVEHGVPGLLLQQVGSDVRLMLPPAGWSPLAGIADSLRNACEAFGSPEALEFGLEQDDRGVRLEVRHGREEATAQTLVFEGPSVIDVVRALAKSLETTASTSAPDAQESFWEEQLAKAQDFDRRGDVGRALNLMDECVERMPPTPQLWLAHAAMLRKAGRRDIAGRRARAALELANEADPGLRARALFEMAAQAWHEQRPDDASRLSEEALVFAGKDAACAPLVSDILSFSASISRERKDPMIAIRLAERGLAAAVAVGNRAKESHARVVLGSALLHAGLTHRAADVLRRAAELAQRHGFTQTGAYALRTLALLDEQVGRYGLAVDEARQSAALAASAGNHNLRDSARVQEVVSLVHQGLLDEARAAADRMKETVANAWENAYSLRYALALLRWREGGGRSASEQMKVVADEVRATGLRFANVARLEECFQLVSLHDQSAAERAILDLEQSGAEVAALQARSALSLAQGDRERCIAKLREAAKAAMLDSADALQIDVNLAWLLVEDAHWDEATPLVGHIAESLCEGLPARILNAALLLVTNAGVLADGEWETLVSASPKLLELSPWLLDPDVAGRLKNGTLRRMPELLTRMCW